MVDTKVEFNVGDRVKVDGYDGVAFYIHKRAQNWVPLKYLHWDEETNEEYWMEDESDGEFEDDLDRWIVIMVGDDREFNVEESELTLISEDDYCGSCGQIGCDW